MLTQNMSWTLATTLRVLRRVVKTQISLRLAQESFEISGPHGEHLCLVREPLREPIWLLRRRFGADKVQLEDIDNFKHFISHILKGLSILHTECHVAHTGKSYIHAVIKPFNTLSRSQT